jgi:putative peptidoglycan lipid II flippase
MAVVTLLCRISGYIRDKALFSVLGAGFLYDAYRTANRIPNAFRGLFAEGTLHAAFVPTLSQLVSRDPAGAEARELFRGLLAVLLVIVGGVVALGIVASPWLVRLYAEGFAHTPEKLEATVLMNRIMFPYLLLISLAALLQAVLNSHERFLLPAVTPLCFNLVVAGIAWMVVPKVDDPAPILAGAVLLGGAAQLAVQWPAVRRLGFSVSPVLRLTRGPRVRQVLVLMLPGIPVLGINQINQLISNRFASYIEGGVSYTYGAYRVTELVFGAIVVQMTTVLLPLLSKEVRSDADQASKTLVGTAGLVSFVTLPSAMVMTVLATPIIGVLFGGGRFSEADVAVTGATLTAYAFSLVGTGHVKVMASAFFARKNTKTPMWGSLVALLVFTGGCWMMVGRLGTPGLGWANTLAMTCFGIFLTTLYARRYGFDRAVSWRTLGMVVRQVVACTVIGIALVRVRPWLAGLDHTSLEGLTRLAVVIGPALIAYVGLVVVLGGREVATLIAAFRKGDPA